MNMILGKTISCSIVIIAEPYLEFNGIARLSMQVCTTILNDFTIGNNCLSCTISIIIALSGGESSGIIVNVYQELICPELTTVVQEHLSRAVCRIIIGVK